MAVHLETLRVTLRLHTRKRTYIIYLYTRKILNGITHKVFSNIQESPIQNLNKI